MYARIRSTKYLNSSTVQLYSFTAQRYICYLEMSHKLKPSKARTLI